MPCSDQLARQWRLLQFVDRPTGVSVDDAAQECDCAVRTILRHLSVLQDTGFPIYDEKASGARWDLWRVSDDFKRRLPLKLKLAKLAALVMSRELMTTPGATVLGPPVSPRSTASPELSTTVRMTPESLTQQPPRNASGPPVWTSHS